MEPGVTQIPSHQVTKMGQMVILVVTPFLVTYTSIGTDRSWGRGWSFWFPSIMINPQRSLKYSRTDSQLKGLMDHISLWRSMPQGWGTQLCTSVPAALPQPCKNTSTLCINLQMSASPQIPAPLSYRRVGNLVEFLITAVPNIQTKLSQAGMGRG